MSFRLSSLGCCLSLALFGGVSFVSTTAYGQGESRPRRALELSETNNAEVLSRLNQLTDKKDAVKEPELDWKKSLGSLSLDNPGALAPQYVAPKPPPISNKRMKDLLERKRNWMLTPEDLMPENSSEDWQDGTDPGHKHANTSSLKQFSEAFDQRDTRNSKLGDDKEDDQKDPFKSPGLPTDSGLQDDPAVPSAIRSSARNLKSWLNSETAQGALNQTEVRSSFEDFFGLGNTSPSQEQQKAEKSYLERYQAEALGSPIAPSVSMANAILNPLAPAAPTVQPLYNGGLESVGSSLKPDVSGQTAANLGSVLTPAAVPDLNSKVFNQWDPLYNPTPPEQPKLTSPSFPTVEFPRRRF